MEQAWLCRQRPACCPVGHLLAPVVLLLVAACATAAPATVAYRVRLGQAVVRLPSAPEAMSRESLAGLEEWDEFAVTSIARGVRGEVRLRDVLPLFLSLLRAGPYAGAFADPQWRPDPFLEARAVRFLDAASRLATGLPIPLLRELLAETTLVTALRQDGSGAAHRGANHVLTSQLAGPDPASALGRWLPALACLRGALADPELTARAMDQVDRGKPGLELAKLLGQTWLWDLRLYLLARPGEADVQGALALGDEELAADYCSAVAGMHLRYFLFGPREEAGAASLWDACQAEEFIRERPEFRWVAQAAALARELHRGTVLTITGEETPELGARGETARLTYHVQPGEGGCFATAHLVSPRSAAKTYEGVRCVSDTASAFWPSPFGGGDRLSALRFEVVFTKAGTRAITFQYALLGVPLPVVSHPITVVEPGVARPGTLGAEGEGTWAPRPIHVELAVPPNGYQPVYNSGAPVMPGQPAVINGGRRIYPLPDGRHAMEHLILYEVRVADEDRFPPEVTYCDPNPRGDRAVAARALDEAEEKVAKPLRAYFNLVPNRLRVLGRECWVGRKGKGRDGKTYYVLCRGAQSYLVRNDLYLYQVFWDPVIGENEIYDSERLKDDTIAFAQAVLWALQVVGAGEEKVAGQPSVPPERAVAYLQDLRGILDEDANLCTRANLIVAAWQQQRLENEMAADTMAGDVVSGYDVLATRAAAMQPPDPTLARLAEGVQMALSIGMAASRLMEKGLRNGEADKVVRGLSMLQGYDTERQALRSRMMTLSLEYVGEKLQGGSLPHLQR